MAFDFDVIIIGSGFGANVLALDQNAKNKRILILERGVWWLTPELSAENPMSPFLKTRHKPNLSSIGRAPITGAVSSICSPS